MSNSGIEEFAHADDVTLYEGMAESRAARPARRRARRERRADGALARRRRARDFMASRPVVAELEAIGRAIAFAEDTGCALHIVHVSSGRGVALVTEARAARRRRDLRDLPALPVPHARSDVEALGAVAKCAPPVRDAAEQRARCGSRCAAARCDMVTSDHSPSPAGAQGRARSATRGAGSRAARRR